MEFLWDENNTAHLALHGISREWAEALFQAGEDEIRATRIRHRYLMEVEREVHRYRLIFDLSMDGTIYVVTCFALKGGSKCQNCCQ